MPKVKQFDETAVLIKAQEVFAEKGYNGTSMDDLVKATGLSRSSIYDTFGDKHGLFLKSLEQYRDHQNGCLQNTVAQASGPKKKIQYAFAFLAKEIVADKKGLGCLMLNVSMEMSCVDKVIAAFANKSVEATENQFTAWVKEGQAAGEISKAFTPKALGRYLANSYFGLRLTCRNRPDADIIKDVIKTTLTILDEPQ